MKTLRILLVLTPIFSFFYLLNIKKDTPVATSVECCEKMNRVAIGKDMAYFNELIKEYRVTVITKDIEVYLVEKIWKDTSILRIP